MIASDLNCTDIARLVSSKQVTAVEIVGALIDRAETLQGYNAFASLNAEAALSAAAEADRITASGEAVGPLHGVPLSFKDNINVRGYPTTAGTPAMRDFRPEEDAPVAKAFKLAGAIVFGKNNMHELAYGATTNNALFGPSLNPFDTRHVCGGSSGGSACAVAARMVPASIGTDTGGSVRVPASFCGLWGFRPTPGRWPRTGIVPISITRDTPGPITRSPSDLALLDSVVVGVPQVPRPQVLSGLRIGIANDLFWSMADLEVSAICERALRLLEQLGAELVPVKAGQLLQHHLASTTTIAVFEGKVTLQEFLDAHAVGQSLEAVAKGIAASDVRAILMSQLGAETAIPDATYAEALSVHRPAIQEIYRRLFRDNSLDVLAFPTSLIAAPLIGEDETVMLNGKPEPLFQTAIHNTDIGSNAGIPGITIPVGLTRRGLPVGLGLDAAAGADRLLLDIAIELETHFPALTPSLPN